MDQTNGNQRVLNRGYKGDEAEPPRPFCQLFHGLTEYREDVCCLAGESHLPSEIHDVSLSWLASPYSKSYLSCIGCLLHSVEKYINFHALWMLQNWWWCSSISVVHITFTILFSHSTVLLAAFSSSAIKNRFTECCSTNVEYSRRSDIVKQNFEVIHRAMFIQQQSRTYPSVTNIKS